MYLLQKLLNTKFAKYYTQQRPSYSTTTIITLANNDKVKCIKNHFLIFPQSYGFTQCLCRIGPIRVRDAILWEKAISSQCRTVYSHFVTKKACSIYSILILRLFTLLLILIWHYGIGILSVFLVIKKIKMIFLSRVLRIQNFFYIYKKHIFNW